ncbi:uncharacterized protein METZ01_LOCUS109991 [marine metagenome]|uniref:Carboxypeptidase Q n=1 Tax=marine metagenome TaxID=408172 RepID=A0A381WYZ7_9ZZZZ
MLKYVRISIVSIFCLISGRSIPEDYLLDTQKIITISINDSTAYKRLSYLCDTFGPRLSGSRNLEKALDWIISEMKADGFSKPRGERVRVPTWIRGDESLQLILPFKKNLSILGLGGSVATPKGGIKAEVIVGSSFEELDEQGKKVRGKIVLFNAPFTTYGETVQYRYKGASAAAKYGAIASLIRSVGPWSMNTPHTGGMGYDKNHPKIPHAAITMEDAMMLGRLHDRGERIVMDLRMNARSVADRWSRNVIAELPGSEIPDEIVVLGGHIDSWDVGQGAHDDGGGCVAAWQAVKLIKDLGLRPKRTLRIVLWTNEENGGRGNMSYRNEHLSELKNHILAIESDGGVFNPRGFGFTGSDEARDMLTSISRLLLPIDANLIFKGGRAADVAPLNDEGVPVMSLKVDGSKYFWYHHTNADTFDKVDFIEFNRCVAAMAIMGYVVADMDDRLPR